MSGTVGGMTHGPPPPLEVEEKGENYCLGFSILGIEGKSPFVRKNEDDLDEDELIEIFDDEIEDGNGRKEEYLGVEEKFVETNSRKMNKEGYKDDEVFTKAAREIVVSCAKKVLGEGSKVNMDEIAYDEGTE
ncbi:hypothetical protein HAX54_015391 [Datura stramonium]|uniref:Uncharacterized protein n=1 Tax=Datura stramonium TaxID=4076 RepID=A0ABS8TS61_DATST|nr:hypothetical protein [Datura stramonium]